MWVKAEIVLFASFFTSPLLTRQPPPRPKAVSEFTLHFSCLDDRTNTAAATKKRPAALAFDSYLLLFLSISTTISTLISSLNLGGLGSCSRAASKEAFFAAAEASFGWN
jgi:hypothetical protein